MAEEPPTKKTCAENEPIVIRNAKVKSKSHGEQITAGIMDQENVEKNIVEEEMDIVKEFTTKDLTKDFAKQGLTEDKNGHEEMNTDITKEAAAFDALDYSVAKEGDGPAKAWIEANSLGDFVNNKMVAGNGPPLSIENSATNSTLCTIATNGGNIEAVLASAKTAKEGWTSLQGHIRSRHLYSLTRQMQKNGRLLAVLECLSTGTPIRECKDKQLARLIQTSYHYTGWAELSQSECKDYRPCGIVAVLIPEVGTLTEIAQQAIPALAAGNVIIISPKNPLPVLLFAQFCAQAGLPEGVVNVVIGDHARQSLLSNESIAHVSASVSIQSEAKHTINSMKHAVPLSITQVGKSSMVVFDNADIESAVECLIESGFAATGQVSESVGRLMVQTSCYEKFCKVLKDKVEKLRVGNPMDYSIDIGSVIKSNHTRVKEAISTDNSASLDFFSADCELPKKGFYVCPTVVLDIQPSSEMWKEPPLGPVVMVTQFRTAKEAMTMVNHSKQGVGCSVWTEKNSLIMQLVKELNVGTVWVNCHGLNDPARLAQSRNCSGSVHTAGIDLLKRYMLPNFLPKPAFSTSVLDEKLLRTFGQSSGPALPSGEAPIDPEESVNRTIKMLIGGALKRSANDAYREVHSSSGKLLASLPDGGRKDVRDAVEAASKALPGWSGKTGYNRAQILYFLAENICRRKEDFAEVIAQSTGRKYEDGMQEVDTSLQRLFSAAAWADKLGGSPFEACDPVGVVGITCPVQWPMLGLVSLLAPAIAAGNTVVIVPSDKFPLAAADLCQVLQNSDIPGGVVNVMFGEQGPLSLALATHNNVQAMWYFGTPEGCHLVQVSGIENKKQVWCEEFGRRKWNSMLQGTGYAINSHCVNRKKVIMPAGQTYAN